jgi:hypothetical protein
VHIAELPQLKSPALNYLELTENSKAKSLLSPNSSRKPPVTASERKELSLSPARDSDEVCSCSYFSPQLQNALRDYTKERLFWDDYEKEWRLSNRDPCRFNVPVPASGLFLLLHTIYLTFDTMQVGP